MLRSKSRPQNQSDTDTNEEPAQLYPRDFPRAIWATVLSFLARAELAKTRRISWVFRKLADEIHQKKLRVVSIFASNNASFVRYSNGEIWGCGSDIVPFEKQGILTIALGEAPKTLSPIPVLHRALISVIKASTIKDSRKHVNSGNLKCIAGETVLQAISIREGHVIYCTTSGKVYTGDLDGEHKEESPQLLLGLEDVTITQIASSYGFAVALSKDGKIYTWGNGQYGALGHGDTDNKLEPTQIEALKDINVVQIAVGGCFVIALADTGKVYGWGKGPMGMRINANEARELSPILISGLEDVVIKQIDAGISFCVALSDKGKVYTWGGNENKQLGYSSNEGARTYLEVREVLSMLGDKRVVEISAGCSHCIALTEEGEVYTWGAEEDFQLGHLYGKYGTPTKADKFTEFRADASINQPQSRAGCFFTASASQVRAGGEIAKPDPKALARDNEPEQNTTVVNTI